MTLEETRQLGIEFERRVQTMIPEKELVDKLDTETIYSYINQYQDKFVHDIYRSLDSVSAPSKPSAYLETIMQGLLKTHIYEMQNVANPTETKEYKFAIPDDFGLYSNSATEVETSYVLKSDNGSGTIPNILLTQSAVQGFLQRPQDNMRIIREPIAYLSKAGGVRTLGVVYDRYTKPSKLILNYYKVPEYMNLMTSTPCELSMDVFEDLVEGAVDLYVQYVAGAEARKRQMAEQAQKQNRKEND